MNPSALIIATTTLAVTVAVAPATASTLSLSIGPDPAAEVPTPITVSGVSDTPADLNVGSIEQGEACTGYETDAMSSRGVQPGSFSESATTVVKGPGSHILCAQLRSDDRGSSAEAMLPYTARAPHVALEVQGPDRVALGARVVMSVRGDIEVDRWVFSALLPPGGTCRHENDLLGWLGPGGGSFQAGTFAYRFEVQPRRFGTWTLCLTTRRYVIDVVPEVLAEKRVRVTIACTRASRALSRARDSWRGRSRWLRLRGRGSDARLRAHGRAIRRARADRAHHCDA